MNPDPATTVDEGGEAPCMAELVVDHRDATPDEKSQAADITTRTNVHDLVIEFYREVVFDDLLEPVFGEIAEVDWAEHIPKLIDYWCWILLGGEPYPGAVTHAHRELHSLAPIRHEHCQRWYELWTRCVDSHWTGPTADRAKAHAAKLMTGLAKRVFGYQWP